MEIKFIRWKSPDCYGKARKISAMPLKFQITFTKKVKLNEHFPADKVWYVPSLEKAEEVSEEEYVSAEILNS